MVDIFKREKSNPKLTIIATGFKVSLGLEITETLKNKHKL